MRVAGKVLQFLGLVIIIIGGYAARDAYLMDTSTEVNVMPRWEPGTQPPNSVTERIIDKERLQERHNGILLGVVFTGMGFLVVLTGLVMSYCNPKSNPSIA